MRSGGRFDVFTSYGAKDTSETPEDCSRLHIRQNWTIQADSQAERPQLCFSLLSLSIALGPSAQSSEILQRIRHHTGPPPTPFPRITTLSGKFWKLFSPLFALAPFSWGQGEKEGGEGVVAAAALERWKEESKEEGAANSQSKIQVSADRRPVHLGTPTKVIAHKRHS
jgi:hypothetical protein